MREDELRDECDVRDARTSGERRARVGTNTDGEDAIEHVLGFFLEILSLGSS